MIAETLDLIRAIDPQVFRVMAGAAEFASLPPNKPPPALPAAYVVPLDELAGAVRAMNITSQNVKAQVGVVIVVGALQDAKGGQAVADLQTARAAVRGALYGVEPAADHEPFTFVQGELLRAGGGLVWWQDTFETEFQLRRA